MWWGMLWQCWEYLRYSCRCYRIQYYDQHNLQVSINTLINMCQCKITSPQKCLPSRVWNNLDKFHINHYNFGVLNTNSIDSLCLLVFGIHQYIWHELGKTYFPNRVGRTHFPVLVVGDLVPNNDSGNVCVKS